MFTIVRIIRDGIPIAQPFVRLAGPVDSPLQLESAEIVKDGPPSLVACINDQRDILKLVRPRKWQEYAKLLWGHSRINKEVRGNRTLRALGMRVPHISAYGLGLLPVPHYEFLGYYVMENLARRGLEDAASMVRSGKLSTAARKTLFDELIHDLNVMRNHQVLYADLKLNNVFADAEGHIVWIDTGVSTYNRLLRGMFRKKYNQSLARILRLYRQDMSDTEIQRITALEFDI